MKRQDESAPRTYEEGIRRAAQALVDAHATNALLTPREQAERAMHATCEYSVDELEDMVRAQRGLPPIHGTDPVLLDGTYEEQREFVRARGYVRPGQAARRNK